MAGGVGSRFWPFSRKSFPKQFHDVLGTGRSLLQQTADRFKNICPVENIYVVTNASYADIIKEQLPGLSDDQILLEPEGRNTAPCIAYACYKIKAKDAEARIVISPSDHVILKERDFEDRINDALDFCVEQEALVTLGIQPSRPDTGYGYIQFESGDAKALKVKRFTEKPNLESAQGFLASGEYVWNAGIFVWTADSIVKAFQKNLQELDEIFAACPYYSDQEQLFIDKNYSKSPEISIDYGIMEKASNVHVVLSDIGWSDLGTWKSLYDIKEKDEHQNVIDGNVLVYDSNNSIIKTPKERLVVVNGVENMIIAEYDNVLMICKKDDEQKVKQFVSDIKQSKDESYY